jgi:hypothetical protein
VFDDRFFTKLKNVAKDKKKLTGGERAEIQY